VRLDFLSVEWFNSCREERRSNIVWGEIVTELKLVQMAPLFYSPLIVFGIADAELLNGKLVEEGFAMRAKSPGQSRSNTNGWHSENDFFRRTEPGCTTLRSYILRAVREVTLRLSPKFDFDSTILEAVGWININPRGAYNRPHTHPDFLLSGTYYVNIPPDGPWLSGLFEFLDPRSNANGQVLEGATCFSRRIMIKPKPGLMMIFPSYLAHLVYPNEQDFDRVSIAFNIRYIAKVATQQAERFTTPTGSASIG
jgi:uncharacterized protein (TIGR02466 family)